MRKNKGRGSFLHTLGAGFIIGTGLIIPGVSGGVLALILGFYEPIIEAVAKPFSNWRQKFALLFPLSLGIMACLLFFSNVLEYLFAHYPLPLLYLFSGLILGGFPAVLALGNKGGFRLSYVTGFGAGFMLLPLLIRLSFSLGIGAGSGFWHQAKQGGLAGLGTVIPGLSASFLLMTFGLYEELLAALAHPSLAVLLPLATGFIPVALITARLFSWLFQRASGYTYYTIAGASLGSLLLVFPGLPRTGFEAFLAWSLLIFGFSTAHFLRGRMVKNGGI